MCASFCKRLFPSNVAFRTELRTNRFLQGKNNLQPANDGTDTTTSEDQVWRLQQIGFREGEVEKGGDAVKNNLVVTLDNLGQHFGTCCERTILENFASCEKKLWGVKQCRVKGS